MPNNDLSQDARVLVGASWYPEMWPEEQWAGDVAKMRQIGFNIVRVFEFAWHRFEPAERQFNLDWAMRLLDLCHANGIAVMAGTPTAAPPAWLTSKYPDTLQTHADGRLAKHGGRKHYSIYSARYRDFTARIVEAMARALAGHPALHSWQIDNEMGGADFGPEAVRGFHEWLAREYGSIENLNRVWGLEFWSQAYSSFDQIPMPTASVGSIEVPERQHPSLIMAIARYNNAAWTSFIKLQCDVIRRYSDKPITTNMTPGLGMHWFQHNRVLDRVGASIYKDVAHYSWALSVFDRMRPEKPAPYWLLETAPSWSAGGKMWNIHRDARGINAFSWLSVLMGGSMVVYWQWREHWAGQEMQHGTLVTATGKWRPNRDVLAAFAGDCEKNGRWLLDHPPAPAQVAIVQSNEAAWAFSIDPIDEKMHYETRWRDDYYLPLVRRHIWRDIIDETRDFSPYRVLLMPLMPIIRNDTRQRLRKWVEDGGLLLLGPLSGYRSEEFTAFTDREFGGLEELIGATSSLRFTVHWVEDRTQVHFVEHLTANGLTTTRTRNWCEAFAPTTAAVLAVYTGGYGDAQPAILLNRHGRGAVLTLGCQVDEATYLSLAGILLREAAIEPLASGSPEVVVIPRAAAQGRIAGYALVNLSEDPQRIVLPRGGTDLLTGQVLEGQVNLNGLQVAMLV